jgi:hypothetical protein
LTRLEKQLVAKPWHEARPGVQVKLLAEDGELCVFAQSLDRVATERAIRRRQLKRLWTRLADSDEGPRAFRDDVARDYEMMSPGFGASLTCVFFVLGRCRSSVIDCV